MQKHFEWIATAAFGLEGVVARELGRLGISAKAENGGARFTGTFEDAFRAQSLAALRRQGAAGHGAL